MQKDFVIFPRFLKDLLQSKDLVRGAATWTNTALSTLQFRFHLIRHFLQGIWHTRFLTNKP